MEKENDVISRTGRFITLSENRKGVNIVYGSDTPGEGYVMTAPVWGVLKVIAGCMRGVELDIAPLNLSHGNDAKEGKDQRK